MRPRIATSSSAPPSERIRSTIAAPSASGVGERPHHRVRPVGAHGPQHLGCATEVRHQPVREGEHLRRRAVVLLQPDDGGVRETVGDAEQVLGSGAGERVDGLVVVADDAEVVPIAQPEVEQRLLQQVHVLVLVDGEGAVLGLEGGAHVSLTLEQLDGALEQILEIEHSLGCLPPFVVAVDAVHQVERDRRLAVGGRLAVAVRADPPVLRPFDLRREVAGGPEPVRAGQAVRDLAERQRLRRQDPPHLVGPEMAQLTEGGGVERGSADAAGAKRGQSRLQLAGGLVGEGDRHDLRRRERTGRHLLRDAPGDRGRLARAGTRENADRAADSLGRAPLLGIQPVEGVHRATLASGPAGGCDVSATCLPEPAPGRCARARRPSRPAWRRRPGCCRRRRAARARRAPRPARPHRSAVAPHA